MKAKLITLVALAVALAGCETTPSGVKIVASSATHANIGDINWDEYKIPVLSLYVGPKATLWVNRNYTALRDVEIYGSVTNRTDALGIYTSEERKRVTMRVSFDHSITNNANLGAGHQSPH